MRRGAATLLAFVVACASATVPQPVQARSALEARAARMSDEAAAHFKAGRFLEAAELFEQAYALDADVIVRLRNAGRSWEEAGRPERALHCFQRYLAKETDPKLRADAEDRISKAREAIAAGKQPDQPASDSPEPAPSEAAPVPPSTQVEASSGGGVPAWALPLSASLGSVALVLTGVAVRQKAEDVAGNFTLHDAAGHYDYPGGAAKRADDESTIATNRGLAWGLIGGGVALAGVATWLWLRDGGAADGSKEQAGVRLLPVATGSNAGLVLSGRF